MKTYREFVSTKLARVVPCGIAEPPPLNPMLHEHQRLLTRFALKLGRAAILAQTGLGKGFMILEWCRVVADHTELPTLILAPLAVSHQFVREAAKLGVPITVCSEQSDVRPGVNVTNYQKIHKFDPASFGGVALDEASILKSLDGSTRTILTEAFAKTSFKLAATATPAPNDHTELGGQSEFLGIMPHAEMLASFFTRDGGSTQDWRLKGHARTVFWKWVASWGALVNMPSDIGCSDVGYILPSLRYHEHIVPGDFADANAAGQLFPSAVETLIEQRAARRGTLAKRVALSAEIANGTDEQVICWCDLNSESEALTRAINGAVEVTGSQSDEDKVAAIESFISGKSRVLVSKPSCCGFGLNLEFATTVVFCGVTHSFEAFFQVVRRSHRYGVKKAVDVHVVSSELEGRVVDNLKRKARDAEKLADETRKYVAEYVTDAVTARGTEHRPVYSAPQNIIWPAWLNSEAS